MYERAPRDLLHLPKERLTSQVGPGTYFSTDRDATRARISRLLKQTGDGVKSYAPFCSLTPRQSPFDKSALQQCAPPPTAYSPPDTALDAPGAPRFSRSTVDRFSTRVVEQPSPNRYTLPSTLRAAPNARESRRHAMRNSPVLLGVQSRSLLAAEPRRDVGEVAQIEDEPTDPAGVDPEELLRGALEARDGNDYLVNVDNPSIHGRFRDARRLLPRNRDGHVLLQGDAAATRKLAEQQLRTLQSPAVSGSGRGIVFQRKSNPPTIPSGVGAAGYAETAAGQLVALNAYATRRPDSAPVASAKRGRRGFTFGASERRLQLRTQEGPAPGEYTPVDASLFAGQAAAGRRADAGASMGTAPCVRMTDMLVTAAEREAVPGPGAYSAPSEFQAGAERPRSAGVTLGSAVARSTLHVPRSLLENPGPGEYTTATAHDAIERPRHTRGKAYAFGSTSSRFDARAERLAGTVPAPGSHQSVAPASAAPAGAPQWRAPARDPTSGRLDLANAAQSPGPAAYAPADSAGAPENQFLRRDRHVVAENRQLLDERVHPSSFSSSAPRFAGNFNADLPSPLNYSVIEAFHSLADAGRVAPGGSLRSHAGRSTLVDDRTEYPSPAEYDTSSRPPLPVRRTDLSAPFLVAEPRFKLPASDVIASDKFYQGPYDLTLERKTFNVTIK